MQIERRTLRGSTRADRVRNRLAHSLSFETAKAAGWNYTDLTLFFSGGYYPSERALDALASVLNMKETTGHEASATAAAHLARTSTDLQIPLPNLEAFAKGRPAFGSASACVDERIFHEQPLRRGFRPVDHHQPAGEVRNCDAATLAKSRSCGPCCAACTRRCAGGPRGTSTVEAVGTDGW